jgi:serine/threonine-protein kinase HipA
LLDAVTFNYLIGNNDAHGKNFSFLYRNLSGNPSASFAPLYDLISTSAYPDLSPKMAMRIGSKYLPLQVKAKHWEGMWEVAGFSKNAAKKRTLQFCEKLSRILSDSHPSHPIEEQIIVSALAKGRSLKALLS